jgi:hypothetical protein
MYVGCYTKSASVGLKVFASIIQDFDMVFIGTTEFIQDYKSLVSYCRWNRPGEKNLHLKVIIN